MNKEELEKQIDINFNYLDNKSLKEVKQFIFETVIPEVLKSIITTEEIMNFFENCANSEISSGYAHGVRTYTKEIKAKAKELYGIDL